MHKLVVAIIRTVVAAYRCLARRCPSSACKAQTLLGNQCVCPPTHVSTPACTRPKTMACLHMLVAKGQLLKRGRQRPTAQNRAPCTRTLRNVRTDGGGPCLAQGQWVCACISAPPHPPCVSGQQNVHQSLHALMHMFRFAAAAVARNAGQVCCRSDALGLFVRLSVARIPVPPRA